MYRIMIVDDEPVVREGMRNNIPWESLGFTLAGVCENGSEALEQDEVLNPDVILTDICMPYMDGLELSRRVLERSPERKIVILTGYDEFDYAQQAIKLKVHDFLLKPVTAMELRKILEKIRRELDEERASLEDLKRLRQRLYESMPLLRERFLNRLVNGGISYRELCEKTALFELDFRGPWYSIAVLERDEPDAPEAVPESPEDRELWSYAIANVCEELLGQTQGTIVFQNRDLRILLLFQAESAQAARDKATASCDQIREACRTHLHFSVTAGIGNPGADVLRLRRTYNGALAALDYRPVRGGDSTILISDMEQGSREAPVYDRERERRIIAAVKAGNEEAVRREISEMTEGLRLAAVRIERVRVLVHSQVVALYNALCEAGTEQALGGGEFTALLEEIQARKELSTLSTWLLNLCRKACEVMNRQRSDYCSQVAFRAEEYIRAHHTEPDLSLQQICRELAVSTSYFSMIFKQKTGETFVEYLTRVRMEHAEELLSGTSLRHYEIAERIGLTDPHYFSILFKKATGRTPSEYRETGIAARRAGV